MCGRFALKTPASDLIELVGVNDVPVIEARYNIAPTQPVLIVRAHPHKAGREATLVTWGLIPPWAKDPSIGARMINARGETVLEKPSFRNAMKRRRCVVPADGFYEWQKLVSRKQPYLIRRTDGRAFVFAGLWEHWMGANGEELESCTIITTSANELMRPLHDRMPVILCDKDIDRWLAAPEREASSLTALLQPYQAGELEAVAVSTRVNSPANEDPSVQHPL